MAPSVPVRNATESSEHARLAAKYLSDFGGERVGRGFGKRSNAGDERDSSRIDAQPHLPGAERDSGDNGYSQVRGDLRGDASALTFRCAKFFLAAATKTGGREGEKKKREQGPERGAPAGSPEVEARGEEAAGERSGRRSGAKDPDQQGKGYSDGQGLRHNRGRNRQELDELQQNEDADEGKDEQQDELRLPMQGPAVMNHESHIAK